jgi:small subunit ribosomal protein S2
MPEKQEQEKKLQIKMPSIDELAKSGAHLGHKTNKRMPKMEPYIYGIKNTIHVIDLEKTAIKLKSAAEFLFKVAEKGGTILFVGTKPAAKDIVKKYAQELELPYVTEKWLGGTLTNFPSISALIKKFNKMVENKKTDNWSKYTKKEQLEKEKELARLEKMIGGIKDLEKKPDAIYLVDLQKEKIVLREAKKSQIPMVAIVDTNSNPELVDYPIPANDDAIKTIDLITNTLVQAIKKGQQH